MINWKKGRGIAYRQGSEERGANLIDERKVIYQG
jgi:hypothetical protein